MKVKITSIKQTTYPDLSNMYENKIDHQCDIKVGTIFYSDGTKPEQMCNEAWKVMEYYVKELIKGNGNFFDGWMKNPKSACISCNDGFRPMSFYLEVEEDE